MLLFILILINFHSFSWQFDFQPPNETISSFFPDKIIDYLINESRICSTVGPDIIIAVHSSPQNVEKRNAIRNSYGAFKRVRDQSIEVIFLVGINENSSMDSVIRQESNYYRDVVQVNFIDSYHNLTLKHIALLNWVDVYCANSSYLIKIDDDTMVDIFHLEYFLRVYDLKSDFYCKVIYTSVLRYGKWAVSKKDYPNDYYPPYCEGFAYILTNLKKLSQIVENALNTKFFWIDDVLLLGNIREKVNMTLQYFPDNFGFSDISIAPIYNIINFIFFRNGNNQMNDTLWKIVWNSILRESFELYM